MFFTCLFDTFRRYIEYDSNNLSPFPRILLKRMELRENITSTTEKSETVTPPFNIIFHAYFMLHAV